MATTHPDQTAKTDQIYQARTLDQCTEQLACYLGFAFCLGQRKSSAPATSLALHNSWHHLHNKIRLTVCKSVNYQLFHTSSKLNP